MENSRAKLEKNLRSFYCYLPGGDPSNTEAFQKAENEVRLLNREDQPNWKIVADQLKYLLDVKTDPSGPRFRDFRLGVWYLCSQCFEARPGDGGKVEWKWKWEGLANGLFVLLKLIQGHGPSDPDKKEWTTSLLLLEKAQLRENIAANTPAESEKIWFPLIRELGGELDQELKARCSSKALEPIRQAVEKKWEQIRPSDEESVEASEAGSRSTADDADNASEGASAEAGPLFEGAITLRAQQLRRRNHNDPEGYRLLREGLYLNHAQCPEANANGRTKCPPPSAALTNKCKTLVTQQEWRELLALAEDSLERHPFWLDLHHLSYLALDHLGSRSERARDAVGRSVVHLVWRLPDLPKLCFADGLAFAEESTKRWVAMEQWRHAWGSSWLARAEVEDERRLIGLVAEAENLVKSKRSDDALSLLTSATFRSSDVRVRIRGRLAAVRAAIAAEHKQIARGLLEDLKPIVEAPQKLSDWDPRLHVEVLCAWIDLLPDNERKPHLDALMKADPGAAVKYLK